MMGSKKGDYTNLFSEEKAWEERRPRSTTSWNLGEKNRISQSTFEAINEAYRTQNMNNIGQLVPPVAPVFPTFMTNSQQTTGVSIRLNLPNLVLPAVLLWKEEMTIRNLQGLLRYNNFIVLDRATLAFFAIGTECDVQAAAQCFVNFHNLVNTVEFKSPNRAQIEAMGADGLIEGFAWHKA
jgi:hypothetical protein